MRRHVAELCTDCVEHVRIYRFMPRLFNSTILHGYNLLVSTQLTQVYRTALPTRKHVFSPLLFSFLSPLSPGLITITTN